MPMNDKEIIDSINNRGNRAITEDDIDTFREEVNKQKYKLIELIRKRPVTLPDMDAFRERCRAREAEFAEMERRMRPDAAWYNFRYGVHNNDNKK